MFELIMHLVLEALVRKAIQHLILVWHSWSHIVDISYYLLREANKLTLIGKCAMI